MQIAHKIEMKPNKEQVQKLNCACGCARFAYNWGLSKWNDMHQAYKLDNSFPKPCANSIKKMFNQMKKDAFPWIYNSPKDANQQPFINLGNAFTRFFKKIAKYPQLKKKKSNESFYISNDKFSISGFNIKLPKIGNVKLTEELRFDGKIISATVSKVANKWFVSIIVDVEIIKEKQVKNLYTGIDLGLIDFATFPNGEKVKTSKFYRKSEKKLKRLHKLLSRKKQKSNNRKKAKVKLAKKYYETSCQRKDFLHKLSTKTCRENQTICIEDLAVKNMIKNHKIAKSISDAGWYEFRRQLQYKCKIYDNNLIIANRFYASSKTCFNCQCKNVDLQLSDRMFTCGNCSYECDRDVNAAKNLCRLGYNQINACGHETSTVYHCEVQQVSWLKQEHNFTLCE